MFNHKSFKTGRPELVDLFGPMGRGDDGERFALEFKSGYVKEANSFLVGRKDNGLGCFVVANGSDTIFYHPEARPVQVLGSLHGTVTEDQVMFLNANVEVLNRDPRYKYLYLQMVELLRRDDLWSGARHEGSFYGG